MVKKALAGDSGAGESASGAEVSLPASESPEAGYREEMPRNPGTGRARISGIRRIALPLGGLLILLIIISLILMQRMAARKAGPAGKTGGEKSSAASKGGVTDDLAGTGFTGGAAKEVRPSDTILTKNQMEEYQSIPAEFRTAISDGDIYRYANRVALRNGYRELSAINANLKNPDWIYPANTFVMLDETRITVVPGDTLWNISKKKLIEMDLNFYNTVKEIKKASGAGKEELLQKIRIFSFSKKHESIIRSLR
jgi:LysM repeat protein